jgi:hypothetical protein
MNSVNADYWELIFMRDKAKDVKCPMYICDEETDEWAAGQCSFYDQNVFDESYDKVFRIRECESGSQSCPITHAANSTCTEPLTEGRLPGDMCDENWPCVATSTC